MICDQKAAFPSCVPICQSYLYVQLILNLTLLTFYDNYNLKSLIWSFVMAFEIVGLS